MEKKSLDEILKQCSFFDGLAPEYIKLLAGCATNVRFETGQFIFREGEEANHFYLIRQGSVALEINDPSRGAIRIQTVGEGDVLGWSWLFPPYRWHLDARAQGLIHGLALDGKCLRKKCEEDTALGYEMMKRFAGIMTERLQATRMQLLDLYAT
ncbi:MAG TPA: cyclic nucleotide-binding domain-containing protein [bacterium]|nr:cyclic nucleotide-binding domain-containing protein [bacterium]